MVIVDKRASAVTTLNDTCVGYVFCITRDPKTIYMKTSSGPVILSGCNAGITKQLLGSEPVTFLNVELHLLK